MTASLSHCADQVRRQDHDRYLTALFIPPAQREAVFTLYALNAEIAKTRDTVSEPMLGEMRLQWWREAIAEAYDGKPREHPVVKALATALGVRPLSRERFEQLIDSRSFDLEDTAPATLAALEDYAARSAGSVLELVQEVLGQSDIPTLTSARQVGTAWALIGIIRAVPFHLRARRLYLPEDLLDAAGVDRCALFEHPPVPGLTQVIAAIADVAERHLNDARAARPHMSAVARTGLLPATLAAAYLKAIRRADHDPFTLPPKAHGVALRLLIASLRRRY